MVVWDRHDYLKETVGQLSDSNSIYKEVEATAKDLVYLVDKSKKLFANLEKKNIKEIGKEKHHYQREELFQIKCCKTLLTT